MGRQRSLLESRLGVLGKRGDNMLRRIMGRTATIGGSCLPSWCQLYPIAFNNWIYGERELHLIGLLADSNEAALDIGASEGVYSFLMRRRAKKCIAFEPNPVLASRLRRRMPNVQVENFALSDSHGEILMRVPVVDGVPYAGFSTIEPENQLTGFPSRQIKGIKVTTRRLDDYDFGPVGLIKIDVEGHEQSVLTGAVNTMTANWPSVIVETEERHKAGSHEYIRTLFADWEYEGFFFLKGRLEPISNFVLSKHQAANTATRVNNFIFVKRSHVIRSILGLME